MQNQPHPIIDHDLRAEPTRAEMALAARRNGDAIASSRGDYVIVGDDEADRPTAGSRILHGLQIIMIIVLAVLSFAIFWIIGLLLNVF